ncbi:MAG: vanadium-dependent haloperoxidase [Acidobacteriota bacterium]|nr:vanadium-dependent haloperoxidase [Acidobacteriota bacterium]
MSLRIVSLSAFIALQVLSGQVEPKAGSWRPFVLSSANQLRLPAPPDSGATTAEIQVLKSFIAEGDSDTQAQIAYWDAGSPAYRWIQIASQELVRRNVPAAMYTRGMALVSVAMYDATVAGWDSKYAWNRARPSAVDSNIRPSIATPASPSYPSEHALTAGAAATVLTYLFPDIGAGYADLAEEAARSRLFAGTQFPSDVTAGLQLGRAVGNAVVAYAQADNSNAVFTGSYPSAPGVWGNPAPQTPLAGTWRPWVLSTGSQVRLDPPPPADSPAFAAEVDAVKSLTRTNATNHSAWFWQPSFVTPWLDTVHREIFDNRLDTNPPRAARAYALATIAQHDATIACWDTKFAFLELRPSMVDPSIVPLFANPPHPGYPSGHACASGASAAVLSYLFPADAQTLNSQAQDAGFSTFYAAIHTMLDVNQGLSLGNSVGALVVDRARKDGSQ